MMLSSGPFSCRSPHLLLPNDITETNKMNMRHGYKHSGFLLRLKRELQVQLKMKWQSVGETAAEEPEWDYSGGRCVCERESWWFLCMLCVSSLIRRLVIRRDEKQTEQMKRRSTSKTSRSQRATSTIILFIIIQTGPSESFSTLWGQASV